MTAPQYQITSELKAVLDLLASQPPPVLFVTGSAGTGKSTLIEIIRQQLKKNLAVVAPTGVAALRVGGQTIHAFFRFPAKPQPSPRRLHGESRRIIDGMDLLVIDEVSMVRADLLDAIDASLPGQRSYPDVCIRRLPGVLKCFYEICLIATQLQSSLQNITTTTPARDGALTIVRGLPQWIFCPPVTYTLVSRSDHQILCHHL